MIIIDKPYVSDFLAKTLEEFSFPVLKNETARELLPNRNIHFIDPEKAIRQINQEKYPLIYTSSENSIGWVLQNLPDSILPEKIEVFKNKARFRKLIAGLYPGFFFREIGLDEINDVPYEELPSPFIIKPTVGFFSLGVHKVTSGSGWEKLKPELKKEVALIRNTYPEEVLNTASFIIEENIEGEEYTVDAFFDREGNPVILGMMHHMFAHEEDTSDRLYLASPKVIGENLERFTAFLKDLGKLVDLRNFPLHLEIRVDESGRIIPIEGNPLRYGGWCTSAELTHYAFGFNPYQYVMEGKKPDWNKILKEHSGHIFSIIILNNNSGIDARKVKSFDYQKLTGRLGKVLELRKVNAAQFHIFGFVYTESRPENFSELEELLHSDLREFISCK